MDLNINEANFKGKEIILDGRVYLSLKSAAVLTGYHSDYLGRLARRGRLTSQRIGAQWFIDKASLISLSRKSEEDITSTPTVAPVFIERSSKVENSIFNKIARPKIAGLLISLLVFFSLTSAALINREQAASIFDSGRNLISLFYRIFERTPDVKITQESFTPLPVREPQTSPLPKELAELRAELEHLKASGFRVEGERGIERIVERVVSGLSSAEVDQRISALNQSISAQLTALQRLASLGQRIDNLGTVTIREIQTASGSSSINTEDLTVKNLTISGTCSGCGGGGSNTSGWTDDGSAVRLTDLGDLVGIGTTSPAYLFSVAGHTLLGGNATTTGLIYSQGTGTSTFSGGISAGGLASSVGLVITGGSINLSSGATSTANNGLNLTAGCFAVSGTCVGAAGDSGTVNSGNAGLLAFYPSGGTTVDDAAQLTYDNTNSSFGIASSTPWGLLSVEALQGTVGTNRPIFVVGDQGTSTPFLIVEGNRGFLGIATSSPSYRFSVGGHSLFGGNATATGLIYAQGSGTSTFTGGISTGGISSSNGVTITSGSILNTSSATSTFTGSGLNVTIGCLAQNGTCLTNLGQTISNTELENSSITVSSSNSTLSIGGSPVSLGGTVTADINLTNPNNWTGLQDFKASASSTRFSAVDRIYIGGTATTTILGNNSTSTFAGGISSINAGGIASANGLTISGGNILITAGATSTANNGFNLLAGCFAVNNACVTNNGGDATTLDTIDSTQFLRSDTSDQFTSGTLTFNSGTILNLSNVSPATILSVNNLGNVVSTTTPYVATIQATSTATSTFVGGISTGGLASTNGLTITGGSILNSSTATSTFTGSGLNVTAGCLAQNGTCLTNLGQTIELGGSEISGTLGTANGGTGLTAVGASSTILTTNGTILSYTNAPSFDHLRLTSTTATSSVSGGFSTAGLSSSNGLTVSGGSILNTSSATSSFSGGLIISAGGLIFSQLNCSGLGNGGALTTNSSGAVICSADDSGGGVSIGSAVTGGTAGSILFVDGGGNLGQDNANFFWDDGGNKFGLATTSPWAQLSVEALQGTVGTNTPIFVVSDQGTSTPLLIVEGNKGNVGLGTTTPGVKLAVVGNFIAASTTIENLSVLNTSTSTLMGGLSAQVGGLSSTAGLTITGGSILNSSTATSTFSGNGLNVTTGCVAANGTCLTNLGQTIDLASTEVAGTLAIGNGGTGLTAVGASSTILTTNGTILSYTNAPSFNHIRVTATDATSTFAGGLETITLNVTSNTASSTFANGLRASGGGLASAGGLSITGGNILLSSGATSTFNNGLNLSSGCFSIGGTCVAGNNSISGSGASGQVTFFNGTNSIAGNDNFFWDNANNRLGVASTSPWGQFSVEALASAVGTNNPVFVVSDQGTSTPFIYVSGGEGHIGLGTTSPMGLLTIDVSTSTHRFPIWVGDKGTTSPLFVVTGNRRVGIGTTTPGVELAVVGNFIAASTTIENLSVLNTSTSTLMGGLSAQVGGLSSTAGITITGGSILNSSTATSTFTGNGLNVTAGCLAQNGTCLTNLGQTIELGGSEITGTLGTANGGTGLTAVGASSTILTTNGSVISYTNAPQFGHLRTLTSTSSFVGITTTGLSTSGGINITAGALNLNNENFTDLTGTGLQNTAGVLTLNATGDWTGTLDSIEGASFLRSDVSDNYTSGTLTFDSGTTLAVASSATSTWTGGGGISLTGGGAFNTTSGTSTLAGLKIGNVLQVGGTATTTIAGNNATSTFTGGITISTGGLTFSQLNCSGLTNGGALTTDSTGGVICSADDGGSMSIGGAVTGGTSGSVLFVDASSNLAQDNANFFWDDTANRFGLGTTTPGSIFSVQSVANFQAPTSTLYTGLIVPLISATTSATSTFTGGVSTGGLLSSGGLTVTSGAILNSSAATSTFTQSGLSVAGGGIASSNGLTITAGSISQTNNATSTLIGGLTANVFNAVSTSASSTLQGIVATGITTSASSTFNGGLAITTGGLKVNTLTSCTALETNSSGAVLCGTDDTSAGGGIATIQENDVDVTTSATVIDFLGSDFNVTGASVEGDIAIDYTNSGIVRSNQAATTTFTGSFGGIAITGGGALTISNGTSTVAGLKVGRVLEIGGNSTTTIAGNGATSTFTGGINITNGCFAKNGTCVDNDVNGVTTNVFTGNGTWNAPSGIKFAQVIVTGSGGGGGGADSLDTSSEEAAGGGGAGGTTIEMLTAATLGASQTVVVGAAGTAGSNTGGNGGAGNASTFGGTLTTATAGGAGDGVANAGGIANCDAADSLGLSAAGGAASTDGDVNLAGGGGNGGHCAAELADGGTGGASYWGGGGRGGASSGAAATAGSNGDAYGSGGGGASGVDSSAGATGGAGDNGAVVVFSYTGSGGDLSEWYETQGEVEPGDIVAVSANSLEYESFGLGLEKTSILEKASSTAKVVGIVSTLPSEVIGGDLLGNTKAAKPIALAGRVPVKISEENGKIKAGDLLTVSSIPGVAMRATKAGITIGRALEDSDCANLSLGEFCKVLVLVNTSYSPGIMLKAALNDSGIYTEGITERIDIGRVILSQMLQEKRNITASSTLSEIFTDRVVAGLEIISPRVLTDTLVVNFIEPVNKDIKIKIAENGEFILERVATSSLSVSFGENINASSTPLLTVDELGNAFFAGALMASELEIGSPEKPGGITLFDKETKSPYCIEVVNSILTTTQGKCGATNPLLVSEPPPEESTVTQTPETNSTSTESLPTESSPTEPLAVPIQETPAAEPTPETTPSPSQDATEGQVEIPVVEPAPEPPPPPPTDSSETTESGASDVVI